MTDLEFDILDELYFLTSFDELNTIVQIDESNLVFQLDSMISKGWVSYFDKIDGDENPQLDDSDFSLVNCFFLASKKGLISHNSK